MWGALFDERMGLSFVYATGPCQCSLSQVQVPWYSRPYFAVLTHRYTNLSLNRSLLYRQRTDNTGNKSRDNYYCWSVTSLHLRGSLFTEPLCRSGLHNLIPLLHARIVGCLPFRYLATLWPSMLQYKTIILLVVLCGSESKDV
jgi:hypothetical protein